MPQHDDLAVLREHLANECTFLAWVRTAIAIVALGFVVAKFGLATPKAGELLFHHRVLHYTSLFGAGLAAFGVLLLAMSAKRFWDVKRQIDRRIVHFSAALDFTVVAILCAVGLGVAVWILVT